MSSPPNPTASMADVFTRFWGDFAANMSSAGLMPQQPPAGGDAMKQMQRIFLDAMSKYVDDMLRSPQFLEMLKTSMNNAIAMKRQLDGFLTNAMRAAGAPTQEDAAETIERLNSLERRIVDRLKALNDRVDAMESGGARTLARKPAAAARGAARRATGKRRTKR